MLIDTQCSKTVTFAKIMFSRLKLAFLSFSLNAYSESDKIQARNDAKLLNGSRWKDPTDLVFVQRLLTALSKHFIAFDER